MHPNHELPHWRFANSIPKMEVAIVQATRAVEAVLGKPGKRDTPSKYMRAIERWNDSIAINPEENYELANKKYIDYYYDLFGIRGDAAHSLGSFPYEISRKLTIEAQSFSWEIMRSYYLKHALEESEAIEALDFNMEIIDREPEDWSTPMTADSDSFPQHLLDKDL